MKYLIIITAVLFCSCTKKVLEVNPPVKFTSGTLIMSPGDGGGYYSDPLQIYFGFHNGPTLAILDDAVTYQMRALPTIQMDFEGCEILVGKVRFDKEKEIIIKGGDMPVDSTKNK